MNMTKRLTLKEAAQKAIQTNDLVMFSKVVDQLRSMGFNYEDTQAFFAKTTGIDADTFEDLCYESDRQSL